jgi:hypothetical protein
MPRHAVIIEVSDKERITGALELADRFDSPDVFAWCVRKLRRDVYLSQHEKFEIAYRYELKDWLDLIVEVFIKKRITELSAHQAEFIGWRAYQIIAKAHDYITDLRNRMAVYVPEISHSGKCPDHDRCTRAWECFWFSFASPRILLFQSDGTRLPIRSLAEALRAHVPSSEISATCKRLAIDHFSRLDVTFGEVEILNEASRAVKELAHLDRVRAANGNAGGAVAAAGPAAEMEGLNPFDDDD